MEKTYYGTKRVTAWPQEKVISEPGQLARQEPGYGVYYEDGYQSWSPKAAFEKAYRPSDAMNFQGALTALMSGHRVTRSGWNGAQLGLKMFVCVMPALQLPPFNSQEPGAKVNDRTAKFIGNDTPLNSKPYFAMFVDGDWECSWASQPGWVPSTMDLFAEDWIDLDAVVEVVQAVPEPDTSGQGGEVGQAPVA